MKVDKFMELGGSTICLECEKWPRREGRRLRGWLDTNYLKFSFIKLPKLKYVTF